MGKQFSKPDPEVGYFRINPEFPSVFPIFLILAWKTNGHSKIGSVFQNISPIGSIFLINSRPILPMGEGAIFQKTAENRKMLVTFGWKVTCRKFLESKTLSETL